MLFGKGGVVWWQTSGTPTERTGSKCLKDHMIVLGKNLTLGIALSTLKCKWIAMNYSVNLKGCYPVSPPETGMS